MKSLAFAKLITMITNIGGRELDSYEIDRINTILGEYQQPLGYTTFDLRLYQGSRELAARGQKIEAIKTLRTSFTPTLGLKEAKDMVESW